MAGTEKQNMADGNGLAGARGISAECSEGDFAKYGAMWLSNHFRQPDFGNMKRPMAGAKLPGSQFGMRRRILAADTSAWDRRGCCAPS